MLKLQYWMLQEFDKRMVSGSSLSNHHTDQRHNITYDSWNRVQTMTYPDGEVVTYHYNAAGQVESMTSNKQGRQSVIVDRIGYIEDGVTVLTLYTSNKIWH